MKKIELFNKIKQKAFTLHLIFLSLIFRLKAGYNLIGKEFDNYGRKISWLFLLKGFKKQFLYLLCNPVNNTRYFEFKFASESLNWTSIQSCLDISSPRLFFIFLIQKYQNIKVEGLNPDIQDLKETEQYLKVLNFSHRANLVSYDATRLPYPDNYFDAITSISVIEHIPEDGDSKAIKEMWRVLKSKGKLIITVPCAKNYYEEWRDNDVYNLGNPKKENKFFFQRFYDNYNIKNRLVNTIGVNPIKMNVFGEKCQGDFEAYIQRWLQFGLQETIKDPLYIANNFQFFNSIDNLPGTGVCGLIFEK